MKIQNAKNIVEAMDLYKGDDPEVISPEGIVVSVDSHSVAENGDIVFQICTGESYNYTQLGYYDPCVDGAVVAIRIWNKDGYQPMATLVFAFGGSFTFEWDRVDLRQMFEKGINAYTIFYDTRAVSPFLEHIKSLGEDAIMPSLE